MQRSNRINTKRALEVIQMAAEETSADSFCGFSEEEEIDAMPAAKRLRTITYENLHSGRSSVISQYSEMSGMNKLERKPTRRPDPRVNNRNALMARENRRRHKEHQERLERENAILQKENEKLKAHLKTKDRQISSLQYEYKYLKSVIANKTQIVEILKSAQSSRLPLTSSLENFRTSSDPSNTIREMSPTTSTASTETATSGYQSPASGTSENSSGTTELDALFHEAFQLNNFSVTDYEMDANALATDPKWTSDPIFSDIPDAAELDVDHFLNFDEKPTIAATQAPRVRNEHSYSENIEDPGVCVHISNNKVSIEFCAKCHKTASDAFIEDF